MPRVARRTRKPTALETLSLDRGWSYPRLADEIFTVTGKRITAATIYRIAARGGTPSRLTQHVLDEFYAALVDAPVAKRA